MAPFVREKPTSRPHSGGEADPSPKQMTSFDPTDILIAQLTNRGMRLFLETASHQIASQTRFDAARSAGNR